MRHVWLVVTLVFAATCCSMGDRLKTSDVVSDTTTESCNGLELVCDVESTHDLLFVAQLFVDEISGVDFILLEYREEGDHAFEKEVYEVRLDTSVFERYEEVGSYTDDDGAEILIYRYHLEGVEVRAIEEFFCGNVLCDGNHIEWDFLSASNPDLSWFIILKSNVCRISCEDYR